MTEGGMSNMAEETKAKNSKNSKDKLEKNAKMNIVKNLIEKGKKKGTLKKTTAEALQI